MYMQWNTYDLCISFNPSTLIKAAELLLSGLKKLGGGHKATIPYMQKTFNKNLQFMATIFVARFELECIILIYIHLVSTKC